MSIKNVLFGKVDLDTIATAFVFGVNPKEQIFRSIAGSANAESLRDSSNLCIEVGGSGRVAENNFDHHEKNVDLSACAQALERLARIIRYIDEVDRGKLSGAPIKGFPSLVQLVSGMLICVRNPEEQMEQGLAILREVMHSGIDPYGCMEPILDSIQDARKWAAAKRDHERFSEQVCGHAKWYFTAEGLKVAVVETSWYGAPGALYGKGADIVIALNPNFEQAGVTYRKFTVAGKDIVLTPVMEQLNQLENGWGGPAHGTICGSPQGRSSELSLEQVLTVVRSTMLCANNHEQDSTVRVVA